MQRGGHSGPAAFITQRLTPWLCVFVGASLAVYCGVHGLLAAQAWSMPSPTVINGLSALQLSRTDLVKKQVSQQPLLNNGVWAEAPNAGVASNSIVGRSFADPEHADLVQGTAATTALLPWMVVSGLAAVAAVFTQALRRMSHCAPVPEELLFLQASDLSTTSHSLAMATITATKGRKTNNPDFADASTEMQLVEMGPDTGDDRLPNLYDFVQIRAYFQRRPLVVAKRVAQVVTAFGKAATWSMAYRGDKTTQEFKNKRAAMLRDTLTSLGPFYIKLGQLLSIRPDVISTGEMEELQKLCDKVPAFPSVVAMKIIEQELGSIDSVFSEISPEPVAAASLGQVYKAKLRSDGKEVAVKVQRPGALETVALDLYICRYLGETLNDVRFLEFLDNSDLVSLVDEFATRLYSELDYRAECQNGLTIAYDLRNLPNIVVPRPYEQYCTKKVHVAEWIRGVKLASSHADDVQDLVNLGIVAYLTQLLGTGLFHADPHPGNLIRTTDGKLAILDFGLMLEINETERYGIIQCVSHLVHRDYDRIGSDLINLGFLPPGTDITPAIPQLADVFNMALAGGAERARTINFNQLASDLAGVTYDYGGRLPPFFLLLIRAIGVLEGIALVSNPDFAIISASYPYIAERLLTDQDPRAKEALHYMIYGDSEVLNVKRLVDLLENVNTYAAVSEGKEAQEGEGVRKALVYIFSNKGVYARELLLKEVAHSVDALNRDALWELSRRVGISAQLPTILTSIAPQLTANDQRAVDNIEMLLNFARGRLGIQQQPGGFPDLMKLGEQGAAVASGVQSVWPQISSGVQEFGLQLMSLLTQKVAARFIRFSLGQGSPSSTPMRTLDAVAVMSSISTATAPVAGDKPNAMTIRPQPAPIRVSNRPPQPLQPLAMPDSPSIVGIPALKVVESGATKSIDFDIKITPGAPTPVDFFSEERQILLTSLKDPNELVKLSSGPDGWTHYQLNPSPQQFLLWRIQAVVYIDVKLEIRDKGTSAETVAFYMKSNKMQLLGNTGFAVPDELKFLIDGRMFIRKVKAGDPTVSHVTGDVRLELEAEVPPDSPLQLIPTTTLNDSGTLLSQSILRNVAARIMDNMNGRYRAATGVVMG